MGALTLLAERTEGYSGSDLHDLCALAAQQPIHRFMEQEDLCAHQCALVHAARTTKRYRWLFQGKHYRLFANAPGRCLASTFLCSFAQGR